MRVGTVTDIRWGHEELGKIGTYQLLARTFIADKDILGLVYIGSAVVIQLDLGSPVLGCTVLTMLKCVTGVEGGDAPRSHYGLCRRWETRIFCSY